METISTHDVSAALLLSPLLRVFGLLLKLSACSLQYDRFIQLMERLLSMPCCATEEDFVQRYRRQLESLSKRQAVPTVERDERGVAYSAADGRCPTDGNAVLDHVRCFCVSSSLM